MLKHNTAIGEGVIRRATNDACFRKAWRILIAKIVDHVRDGFESELRYQRRRAAFAASAAAENRSVKWVSYFCVQTGMECSREISSFRRNSMPSNRKASSSLRVDVSTVTRKLSHF